jgi:ATP-binding cassette subfamily B protein
LGQRITATAGNFGALTNTLTWRVAPPTVDFCGAIVVFAIIDWRMMVALVGSVLLVTTGLVKFGERGRPLHSVYAARAGEVAGETVDVISNMWAIKGFSAREREWRRLADRFDREARAQRRSWMYTERARLFYDVALWALAGSMFSWALYLWTYGRISPGDVVIVTTFTFRILHGSREFAIALVEISQQLGYIDDTLKVVARPLMVADQPAALPLRHPAGPIEFRDVSFSYGESGHNAIRQLSLTISPAQKVGIVGPSGAGKSTLVALLQRLYDVDCGAVLIGEQPVSSVKQDSLRSALAVVPQEITLFHRSVTENIRFARPEASDDELYAAARAAHCDEFIRALPQGYDTLVGERGIKLSGGQRQRIGIARAFLKDAPVIIFDEATSALDTESERKVQQHIVKHTSGRTVIAVAHRLSTLACFDRILVMSQGQIVEDGAPAQLLGKGGLFARMWRLQADGFALDHESL